MDHPEKETISLMLDADCVESARALGVDIDAAVEAALTAAITKARNGPPGGGDTEACASQSGRHTRNGHPLEDIEISADRDS